MRCVAAVQRNMQWVKRYSYPVISIRHRRRCRESWLLRWSYGQSPESTRRERSSSWTLWIGVHLSICIPNYCDVLEQNLGPYWKETNLAARNICAHRVDIFVWYFFHVLGASCQVRQLVIPAFCLLLIPACSRSFFRAFNSNAGELRSSSWKIANDNYRCD